MSGVEDRVTTEQNGEHNWYSNDTATLGDRLADARVYVGLSQEELAHRIGVKVKTLQAWENDMSEPRANRLSMLSGLLNVSLRWMMTGEGEGLPNPDTVREIPGDITLILTELRQTQGDLVRIADRIGKLEKRLKTAWVSGV